MSHSNNTNGNTPKLPLHTSNFTQPAHQQSNWADANAYPEEQKQGYYQGNNPPPAEGDELIGSQDPGDLRNYPEIS